MALYYRHKQTRTEYVHVQELPHGLLRVKTVNGKYPYLVNARNVETFDPDTDHKIELPIPKPKNRGASFLRGSEWINIPRIKLNRVTWLYIQINNHRRDLYKFKNAASLQMEVDYIAAMEYRLEHPYE